MKYLLAFIGGIACGVALFVMLVYFNPLARRPAMSPLAVAGSGQMEFAFAAGTSELIAAIGVGPFSPATHPARVQQLWEPTVKDTTASVALLRNSRGQPAGLGIKFATVAQEPGILNGIYPVHSVWHVWLADRGGLLIDQTENRWSMLREIVLPAILDSADVWRGTYYGVLTNGPNSIGTGRVAGGSGSLAGLQGEAVEAINARAWSAESGPVTMEGRLTVAITPQE